jgi:HAD superfamily hydrolase (TIGR01549 family)
LTRTKTLWIRETYLAQILAGRKTIEVRVGYDNIRRLEPGDRLRLNDRHLADVRRVAHYPHFEALLAAEAPDAIAPGVPPDELLATLRDIYPPEKESLGAVALEVAPRRYDAVLFDVGYTLVYFDPPQVEITQHALRTLGIERSAKEIRAADRAAWSRYYEGAEHLTFPATEEHNQETQRQLMQGVLEALGVETDEELVVAYMEALEVWFSQPGVIRPYPEVEEILAFLRREAYQLGIVSNWSWDLRDRMEHAGLDGYFELVWASAYAGCNKPNPLIFEQALAQMGLEAGRALYVGDSYPHDVVGARAAGLDAVLIDRSPDPATCDCPVIHDLRALLPLLNP